MRRIDGVVRVRRLIEEAIEKLDINLSGLSVLTEAASGPFIVTPLIAALAGAKVVAVTRNSTYGSAAEVIAYGEELAEEYDVSSQICFTELPAIEFASETDIVTNLGFVRPITENFIKKLPPHASISLMWEPWEFRGEDLDLNASIDCEIPVVGTCETDSRLKIFEYVGAVAAKLLFESGIEIFSAKIGLIASTPFSEAILRVLNGIGAQVVQVEIDNKHQIKGLDALVLAEHRDRVCLISDNAINAELLAQNDVKLIHIAGNIDYQSLIDAGVEKHPAKKVDPGYMTVTTDYVGPKPVIDLHAAGLKVGELIVRARLLGMNYDDAINESERSGIGLRVRRSI